MIIMTRLGTILRLNGTRINVDSPNMKAEKWDVRGSRKFSLAAAFRTDIWSRKIQSCRIDLQIDNILKEQ